MQTVNSAEQLLRKAEEIMAERGKQYDSTGQNRERSMGRIVAAFNCLYGTSLTEQQGWYFMLLVKIARQEVKPHKDSMEDAIAYAALAGEAGFTQLGAMPTPQHLMQQDSSSELADLRAKVVHLQESNIELRKTHSGRAEYWTGELENARRTIAQLRQEIDETNERLFKARAEIANYEATAQELTQELEQARSEIFSLNEQLKHSFEQRDSLHAQVLEATASADKWHDKANSLENSLRMSEQAVGKDSIDFSIQPSYPMPPDCEQAPKYMYYIGEGYVLWHGKPSWPNVELTANKWLLYKAGNKTSTAISAKACEKIWAIVRKQEYRALPELEAYLKDNGFLGNTAQPVSQPRNPVIIQPMVASSNF